MASVNVFSVGQVNAYVKRMFDEDYLLRHIFVRGEVSNCKYHSSGHIYFTLKDASGTLSCVMFAGNVRRGLSFHMKEGDSVVAEGSLSVYERTGAYQLYVSAVVRDGAGLLHERYELLKKRLEESGMFSEEYKVPIPRFIQRLGVVTAPTGAAVRDIINVATRRNPYVQIILYPAIVQGDEAKESIIRGIRALDGKVDVIIIGRGGGSIEDLWAFNEEEVAEAVFNCRTPIISAVGHETDFVITDYVADRRAPTPSAAAELAVFEYSAFVQDLRVMRHSLTQAMLHKSGAVRREAESLRRDFIHLSPANQIRDLRMQAAQMSDRLENRMQMTISLWKARLLLRDRLQSAMDTKLTARRHTLQLLAGELEKVSPVARLSGSYGFVTDADGKSLSGVGCVKPGDLLHIRMKDGRISAQAREVEKM
ncbi:MAG: exodeoxyribonuclease VII large subunit [Lachnospiraceae bacterium]|nr:exodeoxyribonuclease VII large subunit [Lachnospiraceae bacterium]